MDPVIWADKDVVIRGQRKENSFSFKKSDRHCYPLYSPETDPLANVKSHGNVWMNLLKEKLATSLTEDDRSYYEHELKVMQSIMDCLNEG